MSDYIKREDAEKLKDICTDTYADKEYFIEQLKAIPSADVVEVVRCKDCKYAEIKDNGVLRKTAYCHRLNVSISGKGKGYCYLGERKDGEEE